MRNRGFTLLEMLVSIGIVLLLIAILIPATGAMRRRSKVTLCASNLRQIGQAIVAYRSELRRWPDAAPIPAPFIPPGWRGSTLGLPEAMSSYLSPRSGVYRCPGDEEVFPKCASQPGGFGISYFFSLPIYDAEKVQLSGKDDILWDFQSFGPNGDMAGEAHPPRRGMNGLKMDGSVEFGWAKSAGP
jgi:prepilin-type N-terminal cleavage/methylation domain-containing protein